MACFGESNLRIIDVEGRGKCAYATKAIAQGEIILREPPFIIIGIDAITSEVTELSAKYPSIDSQLFSYYLEYERMTPEQQAILFEFYSPTDSAKANNMRFQLLDIDSFADNFDIEMFIKVAMALHYNGAEVTPPPPDGSSNSIEYGIGLYPVACKISHSCDSNCGWYLNGEKWRVVQSLIDIDEGAEITVDYSMELLNLVPTILRREHLKDHFDCACARCNSDGGDETRRVNCCSNNQDGKICPGFHLIRQNTLEESPVFLACEACHSEAPDDFASRMLQWESSLASQVDYYDEALDDVLSDQSSHDLSFYDIKPDDIETLHCFS